MEIAQQRNFRGQRANRSGSVTSFAMQVDAKASQIGNAIGGIRNLSFAILPQAIRGESRKHGGLNFLSTQVAVVQGYNLPFDPHRYGSAMNQQEVASATFNQSGQPAIESCCGERIPEFGVAVVNVADQLDFGGVVHVFLRLT